VPPAGFWNDWSIGGGGTCMYIMFQNNAPRYDARVDTPVNLGLLLEGEYAGTYDRDGAMRCPSTPPESYFADSRGVDGHLNFFYSASRNRWVNMRAGFIRQMFPDLNDLPYAPASICNLRPDQALYADAFSTGDQVLERHVEGVNSLYVDGRVTFVRDSAPPFLALPTRNANLPGPYWGTVVVWDFLEKRR
jgi:prepilin-type processing-associated H-X9-DG protein